MANRKIIACDTIPQSYAYRRVACMTYRIVQGFARLWKQKIRVSELAKHVSTPCQSQPSASTDKGITIQRTDLSPTNT
jgi:hypothetical protein